MVDNPIGFERSEEEKKEEAFVHNVEDLDKEFVEMMGALEDQENAAKSASKIRELLQKELIRLHKWSEKLIDQAHKRWRLNAKYGALFAEEPYKAEPVLAEMFELDRDMQVEVEKFRKEVNEYLQKKASDLYAKQNIEEEERKHITRIALTISNNLESAVGGIVNISDHQRDEMGRQLAIRLEAFADEAKRNAELEEGSRHHLEEGGKHLLGDGKD